MRTPPPRWLPAPHQLEQAPELAVLAALDRVVELAACALQVAHPESHGGPEWTTDADGMIAEELLRLFEDLRLLLSLYRDETLGPTDLVDEHADEPHGAALSDDDFPF